MKDFKEIARGIIYEHTEAMMNAVELHPKSNRELYEYMTEECAFILAEQLLNGELTPMEYNNVRNELADMLWSIFEKHIDAELQQEHNEFMESLRVAFPEGK